MKFFYMPNERDETDLRYRQVGVRNAFERLVVQGKIQRLAVSSFYSRTTQLGSYPAYRQELVAAVTEMQPDILFVQHIAGSMFDDDIWRDLLAASPRSTLVYHDEDPYDRWVKRIDRPMRALLRHVHVAFISGFGFLAEAYSRLGAERVCYLPHYFDSERFGLLEGHEEPEFDLVAIASCGRRKRLPLLFVPGGRRRYRLFEKLSAIYGRRFALFGAGWDGLAAARGVLPFIEQERAIRKARISVNWDHFDEIPFYCSDRLPISLAVGVPHVTSYHSGYEQMFAGCRGLYWGKTPQEIVDCVAWLLSRSDDDLRAEGEAAREWVRDNLEANSVFQRAFEISAKVHCDRRGASA